MAFKRSFDCSCDLYNVSIRKTTNHFEFYRICTSSFYKILKISIFGKLTSGLENVFKQQRLQRPIDSTVIADKDMSRIAFFCEFLS